MPSLTRVEGSFISVSLGSAAIAVNKRVTIGTDGLYVVAGLTDHGDAVLDEAGAANATGVRARLSNADGTTYAVAAGAIATAGLPLYSAAAGCVSTTQGTNAVLVGKSLAAAADGATTTMLPA